MNRGRGMIGGGGQAASANPGPRRKGEEMDPITLGLIGLGVYFLCRSTGSRFTYKKKYGSWRAYFNGNPPSKSHVLRDGDGYYVCWDRPLRTREEAQRIAKHWMETYG